MKKTKKDGKRKPNPRRKGGGQTKQDATFRKYWKMRRRKLMRKNEGKGYRRSKDKRERRQERTPDKIEGQPLRR